MNGTELRSFSHFQILTKIAYPDLIRNLENWPSLMFAFIPCETVKVSENDQIRIEIWFRSRFWMNGTELRSFSHFKFWPKPHTRTLAENLKIYYFRSFSSFTVKLWKSVKMIKFKCKLDLQVFSWCMLQI